MHLKPRIVCANIYVGVWCVCKSAQRGRFLAVNCIRFLERNVRTNSRQYFQAEKIYMSQSWWKKINYLHFIVKNFRLPTVCSWNEVLVQYIQNVITDRFQFSLNLKSKKTTPIILYSGFHSIEKNNIGLHNTESSQFTINAAFCVHGIESRHICDSFPQDFSLFWTPFFPCTVIHYVLHKPTNSSLQQY